LALRPILVALVASAALTTGSSRVSAGINGWDTATAVIPGGTLTINETVPNVVIANSTTLATCPVQGLGTDFITYTCDPSGPGIPAGSHMLQTWSNPSGSTTLSGPYSEAVTYNASGPLNGAQDGPNPCTNTETDLHTAEWSCSINQLAAHYPETLTVYVVANDQSLFINGLHGMPIFDEIDNAGAVETFFQLGMCPFDFDNSTSTFAEMVRDTQPANDPYSSIVSGNPIQPTATGQALVFAGQQWADGIKAVYNCSNSGDEISTPGDTTLSFDVGTSATTMVKIAQVVSYPNPPPPTTETIYGQNPPLLTSINPVSGPPGTTVTLTGTDLKGFAISFGAAGGSVAAGPPQGSSVAFSTPGSPPPNEAGNVICNDAGTSCTATVPAAPAGPGTTANVTLTDTWGTSNALTFAYTAAAAATSPTPGATAQTVAPPQLTSIDPSSGPGGTTVMLTGTNLTASGATTVAFGQTPATNVRCNDAGTSCTAKVPSGDAGKKADVTLTTSAGTSNTLKFTYSAAPSPTPRP